VTKRSLAAEHPRWGYRRLHVLLAREGMTINRKRVYRLYRLDSLAVRQRKRKRAARIPRGIVSQSWRRGEAWAMDFMQDTLAAGTMAVLISHRFSTVRMARRIVVIEDGVVSEDGSHDELLFKGGRYAELFDMQAASYRA